MIVNPSRYPAERFSSRLEDRGAIVVGKGDGAPITSESNGFRAAGSLFAITCYLASIAMAANPPAASSAAGFAINTFSSDFSRSSVDLAESGDGAFSWFPWHLFGSHTRTAAIVLNPDHSVTLEGDSTGPNGELLTATAAHNARGFVGTAFGGGAYIEAEFKFDTAAIAAAGSKGWPAFWCLPLEASVLTTAQWPGQARGYIHSVEADIFEYLFLPYGGPKNAYGATLHDWYGIPNLTCPRGLCHIGMSSDLARRLAPSGTDFGRYHRYGLLWRQATQSSKGYARFYFDGQAVGPDQQWTQYINQPPPPTNQPWAFGRIDQQHLVLILGTGPNEPMTIRSVNVWQASASENLRSK